VARVLIEDLIASPGALEAQRIEVQPGGGSGEAYTHPGEEFIYVLGGCLCFLIDEAEQYRLGEGDSSLLPERAESPLWNDGDAAAIGSGSTSPLVEPRDDMPRGR
jgi:quercetin dioxygenase-like cupin family protein